MKSKKNTIIMVISLLLVFFIELVISVCLFYIPCFSYSNDYDLLRNYFDNITDEQILSQASNDYNMHYPQLQFSYGDVILELAEYDYFLIEQDEALKILKDKNLDSNAYQVNVILYSYAAKQKTVSNIVYFEYENDIYALVFYYDDAYVGEYRAIFKTNINSFPESFNDKVYLNHDLIAGFKSDVLYSAFMRGLKVSLILFIFETALVYILKKLRKNSLIDS